MLRQLVVGCIVATGNIAIHALVMTVVVRVAQRSNAQHANYPARRLTVVMIATVWVLMAAHAAEVAVWALGYHLIDAAPAGADLMYFAFVNYTTLGYGDVVMSPPWRLLGPIEAADGMLMFGFSTAIVVSVIQRVVRNELAGISGRAIE